MELLDEISQRLQQGMTGEVKRLVQRAIDEGVPAQTSGRRGCASGWTSSVKSSKETRSLCPKCCGPPAP